MPLLGERGLDFGAAGDAQRVRDALVASSLQREARRTRVEDRGRRRPGTAPAATPRQRRVAPAARCGRDASASRAAARSTSRRPRRVGARQPLQQQAAHARAVGREHEPAVELLGRARDSARSSAAIDVASSATMPWYSGPPSLGSSVIASRPCAAPPASSASEASAGSAATRLASHCAVARSASVPLHSTTSRRTGPSPAAGRSGCRRASAWTRAAPRRRATRPARARAPADTEWQPRMSRARRRRGSPARRARRRARTRNGVERVGEWRVARHAALHQRASGSV